MALRPLARDGKYVAGGGETERERDGEEETKKVVGIDGVWKETERHGKEEGKNKVGVEGVGEETERNG